MASTLPTGQEKPKGYEAVYEDDARNSVLVSIDCVLASQLSSSEIGELKELRTRALEPAARRLQIPFEEFTFEREINLWPEGKTLSDKMVFRYYRSGELCGYALVIIGWPHSDEWAIQHLIIEPSMALQGIGSAIVKTVERYAYDSTAVATSMVAIPVEPDKGGSFWTMLGYADESGRKTIRVRDKDYDVILYRKTMTEPTD